MCQVLVGRSLSAANTVSRAPQRNRACRLTHQRQRAIALACALQVLRTPSATCSPTLPATRQQTALIALALGSAFHLVITTGNAWAEPIPDATPPPDSGLPSLPSPSEIVRSLSEQFFGGGSGSETAPSLTEAPEQQAAPGPDAGAPEETPDEKSAAEAKELARLIEKFEGTILPKIKSQIAGLDQQEVKTDAMLELRRELQAAQQDIEELVALAREGNSLGAHAEAQRLQSEFNDIRDFVKAHGGELVQ